MSPMRVLMVAVGGVAAWGAAAETLPGGAVTAADLAEAVELQVERQAAAAAVLALPADAGEAECSPISVDAGPDGPLIGPAELAAGDARVVLRHGASLSAPLTVDSDCVAPATMQTVLRYLRALAERDALAP